MGKKKTKKVENNACSKNLSLKCQFQVSTSHFGSQKDNGCGLTNV